MWLKFISPTWIQINYFMHIQKRFLFSMITYHRLRLMLLSELWLVELAGTKRKPNLTTSNVPWTNHSYNNSSGNRKWYVALLVPQMTHFSGTRSRSWGTGHMCSTPSWYHPKGMVKSNFAYNPCIERRLSSFKTVLFYPPSQVQVAFTGQKTV